MQEERRPEEVWRGRVYLSHSQRANRYQRPVLSPVYLLAEPDQADLLLEEHRKWTLEDPFAVQLAQLQEEGEGALSGPIGKAH